MNNSKLRLFGDRNYTKVILLSLLTSALMILPFIINGKGLFTVADDFNYQQIPFNVAANQAIKSGDIFWDWNVDLGSSFIGAYSFYNLGSPFFWISLLFPAEAFPYVIGPMMIVKYCVAAVAAYAFIKRFVQNGSYAVLGALLYSFSGFQTGNLLFNHFHDVVALFPLMLIGLEKIVEEKKHGWLALATALNALVNYVFFIGEAVFLVVYFCLRWVTRDGLKGHIRTLLKCLLEGFLGIGAAAVILLPSIMFTLENPRLSTAGLGIKSFIYHISRYPQLLRSILMPADIMPYPSTLYNADYSSCFAYLPLFGFTLAAAYLFGKRDWLSKLIIVCLVIAGIPLLNSLFYLLNETYSARWFYMPVLLFSLSTAIAAEQRKSIPLKKGMLTTSLLTAALILFTFFFPLGEGEMAAALHPEIFAVFAAIAVAGLLITYLLYRMKRNENQFIRASIVLVIVFSVITGGFNLYIQQEVKKDTQAPQMVYDEMVKRPMVLRLPDEDNYRVQMSDEYSNFAVLNEAPSVNSFISTVEGSIFRFYQSIGSVRYVVSFPRGEGVPQLLSVRYYLTYQQDSARKEYMSYHDGTRTTYIYERDDFIPLGFTYDYFISESRFLNQNPDRKTLLLLKALIVPDEAVDKVKSMLQPLPEELWDTANIGHMADDIKDRQAEASYFVDRRSSGFIANISCSAEKFAFFSVPNSPGWSAKVNGKPVEILDSIGMMAVPVQPGENEITFAYETPGLMAGAVISLASVATAILYTVYFRRRMGKKPR